MNRRRLSALAAAAAVAGLPGCVSSSFDTDLERAVSTPGVHTLKGPVTGRLYHFRVYLIREDALDPETGSSSRVPVVRVTVE